MSSGLSRAAECNLGLGRRVLERVECKKEVLNSEREGERLNGMIGLSMIARKFYIMCLV